MSELLAEVEARAQGEGRHLTSLPGLWFFRATAPFGPVQSAAKMVTLAVILRGRKRVDFARQSLTYAPGQFLFVTGEQSYVSEVPVATPRRPYLSVAVQLPPAELAEVIVALDDAGSRPDPGDDAAAVVGQLTPDISDALRRLVSTLDDPVSTRVLGPLVQRELLVHLLRSPSGQTLRRAVQGDDGRIRRAVAYIDAHAHERLTVEQLARQARMSPSHFAHRFRQVVRMSPIQYQKHVRLQQARLLLIGERLGAAEAGLRVGYASPSHFARDFKNYFGAPPSTYAARLQVS